jgi:hypothetical protein
MTDMKYVRLFAGPDGETHFEDVPVAVNSPTSPRGLTPFAASTPQLAQHFQFISFAPGWRSEHSAPTRQFIICLAGTAGMRTSDGETRHFHSGDVLLAEDITGNGHTTWNDGEDTLFGVAIPLRD